MSNIKPEALEQEYSERKVFLKILRSSLENNCAGVSFIMKVHAGWIESNFYFHVVPGTGAFE